MPEEKDSFHSKERRKIPFTETSGTTQVSSLLQFRYSFSHSFPSTHWAPIMWCTILSIMDEQWVLWIMTLLSWPYIIVWERQKIINKQIYKEITDSCKCYVALKQENVTENDHSDAG